KYKMGYASIMERLLIFGIENEIELDEIHKRWSQCILHHVKNIADPCMTGMDKRRKAFFVKSLENNTRSRKQDEADNCKKIIRYRFVQCSELILKYL
ncbi:3373_t:CDS:2, partial [Dentiscutata heterogama]